MIKKGLMASLKGLAILFIASCILVMAGTGNSISAENLGNVLLDGAYRGNLPLIKSAVDKGAGIETRSTMGSTPLMVAAGQGHK